MQPCSWLSMVSRGSMANQVALPPLVMPTDVCKPALNAGAGDEAASQAVKDFNAQHRGKSLVEQHQAKLKVQYGSRCIHIFGVDSAVSIDVQLNQHPAAFASLPDPVAAILSWDKVKDCQHTSSSSTVPGGAPLSTSMSMHLSRARLCPAQRPCSWQQRSLRQPPECVQIFSV